MPPPVGTHDLPLSRVIHTPPVETPRLTCRESRGSTQMEWIPGCSAPLGPQSSRLGWSHNGRLSSHVSPLSFDLKSPPGIVPHQTTPGWSAPLGDIPHISL